MLFKVMLSVVVAMHQVHGADKCEGVGLTCSQDCESVLYCLQEGLEGVEVQSCNGTGFYCNPTDHTCSATRCGNDRPEFLCTKGDATLFPDPYNVSISYLCMTGGGPPLQQCSCPDKQCFSTEKQCVAAADNGNCGREEPDCSGGAGTGDFYPSDPGYYYLCNSYGDAIVFKCDAGSTLNETSLTCTKENNFSNLEEDQKGLRALGTCSNYP